MTRNSDFQRLPEDAPADVYIYVAAAVDEHLAYWNFLSPKAWNDIVARALSRSSSAS